MLLLRTGIVLLMTVLSAVSAADIILPTGTITGTQVYGPADSVTNVSGSTTVIGSGANVRLLGKVVKLNGGFSVTSGATFAIQITTDPPVVAITAPAPSSSSVAGTAITLTATASDPDAGGSIASVEFFANGVSLGAPDTTSPYGIVWTNPPKGAYTLTARALDASLTPAVSSGVPITVTSVPPSVSITSPTNSQVFTPPVAVVIDATASDSDGTVSKVEFWADGVKLGEDASSPYSYTWNTPAAGVRVIQAKAIDNDNDVGQSATVSILVNTPPTVALTSPAGGHSVQSGNPIELTAAAGDSDGSISKVEFYTGTTKLGEDDTAPYAFTWGSPTRGAHVLTARAIDNQGGATDSTGVGITVINRGPVVTWGTPAADSVLTPGTIALTATASDVDGSVTKVEFFNGSTLIGQDTSAPYTVDWVAGTTGTHPLLAKATDDDGAVTSTAYIPITILNNLPPVADFAPIAGPNSRDYTFDGTLSSDPNGDAIVAYEWAITSYPGGAPLLTSTAPKPTYTFASTVTAYNISLRVQDVYGAWSTLKTQTNQAVLIASGTASGDGEEDDDGPLQIGDTRFLDYSPADNWKRQPWTWQVVSGPGEVLFEDTNPNLGECERWKAMLTHMDATCGDSIKVKATKAGKVKIRVTATGFTGTPPDGTNGDGTPSSCTTTGGGWRYDTSPGATKDFDLVILPKGKGPPKMPLGGKFRRVDVHGVPMPDPSPTGEGEQDRVPNMSYTDMFNLQPTYSVTDMVVPVDGGELTLEFRRTLSVKSRVYHYTDVSKLTMTYPTDDLLGLGWDANLGSRVIVTERNALGGGTYRVADVTDETGGTFSYQVAGSGAGMVFTPDLAHSYNTDALKATVTANGANEIRLVKPHGTTVIYEYVRTLYPLPASGSGSPCTVDGEIAYHAERYYRLKTVTDRNGNQLQYAYYTHGAVTAWDSSGAPQAPTTGDGPNGDMVVKTITFVNAKAAHGNDTLRKLTIGATWHPEYAENAWRHLPTGGDSGWRIDSVTDPLGRQMLYTYTPPATISPSLGLPAHTLTGLLQAVTRPSALMLTDAVGDNGTETVAPAVQFTYTVQDLPGTALDPVNPPPMDGPGSINRFVMPATITDARGHVTTFTFQLTDWFPTGFYPSMGGALVWQKRPRLLSLQTIDGTASFAINSLQDVPPGIAVNLATKAIETTTRVTDTRGTVTTFKFFQKLAQVPNEIGAALYVTKMERSTAGVSGDGNTGKAIFEWSDPYGLPDPNGNLTKVTDMSGNTIQFVYTSGVVTDTFDKGMLFPAQDLNGFSNPNRYMVFGKPAKRIVDPGGLDLVTEYRYNKDRFNKQSEEIDAEGKRTVYEFDLKGNRTQVREAVGTAVERTTSYLYDTNGFITQKTDPYNRVTTYVQSYPADQTVGMPADVRIGSDPANELQVNAYQRITETVTGYGGELALQTITVTDVMGNTRWTTDPRGNSTRQYIDAHNRVVKVQQPPVTVLTALDGTGSETTSTVNTSETFYDRNGNVRKVSDFDGNVTVTTYDAMNRVTKTRVRMTAAATNDDANDLITETNYSISAVSTNSVGLPRYTIDANGRQTDFEYDNLMRLTKTIKPLVTLPGGGTARHTVENIYGPNSGSGAFAYWSGWQPVRVKLSTLADNAADRRFTDTIYDNIYRPIRVIRRMADTVQGNEDPVLTAPKADEAVTDTFYTKTHKPIRQVVWSETWAGSPSNQTTWTSYDSLYRPTVVLVDGKDGNGSSAEIASPPPTFVEDGFAYANTDVNALITTTKYDTEDVTNKERTRTRDAVGFGVAARTTTTIVDGAGRVERIEHPQVTNFDPQGYKPNGTLVPKTTYGYDAAGNRTLVEDANGTKTRTEYDARNRPVRVIVDLDNNGTYNPATFAGIPDADADLVTTTVYNQSGKPVRTTDSRGYATDLIYDRANRLLVTKQPLVSDAQTIPASNTRPEITSTYDKNGNVLTMQDARQKVHAAGVKVINTYDELNRLRMTVQASGDATAATTTETEYDHLGNVTALILTNTGGAKQVTTYEYDHANRRTKEILPPNVAPPGANDGITRDTITAYYRNGAVRTVTDAMDQVHEFSYDRAGRQTQTRHKLTAGQSVPEETRDLTWSKTGKLLTVSDKAGTTTNAYDNSDRLLTEQRAAANQLTYVVTTSYDAIGRRTRVVYPDTARTTINHYDRGGRLVRVNDATRNTDYTYDTNGNCLTQTQPSPNSVVTTNTYDALNRLVTSFSRKGTTTVSDFTNAYDLVGNRLQVVEKTAGQGSAGITAERTIVYTYDAKYQLLSESWGKAGGGTYSNTYTYDLAGNRTQLSTNDAGTVTTTTYVADNLNRLTSSTTGGVQTTYEYDKNGNQTKQTTGGVETILTWDVHNRLVSVVQGANSLASTYDFRTRRATTTVNGGTQRYFRYDGGVSFHEVTGGTSPTVQVEFLRGKDMGGGIGSILSSKRGMLEETFAYNPNVGHVTALTDANGLAIDSDWFDAYGNIVGASFGSSLNNRLANTKERNVIGTLALDNHGFRYYNPVTGRYLSRDPLGYPDGLNNYLYVRNNPINRIDPLGLSETWNWSWWDVVPGVQIVHALFDVPALIVEGSARSYYGGKMAQDNIEAMNKVRQMRVEAGRVPVDETAGPKEQIENFRDAAQEAAQLIPGTSFTGPASGPSKPGYVPPVLQKELAENGAKQATKSAVNAATGDLAAVKWYHGTSTKNVESIMNGLNPEAAVKVDGDTRGFFVTSDPKVAMEYARMAAAEQGGQPVVLSADGKVISSLLDDVPNPAGGEKVIPVDKFDKVKPMTFKKDQEATDGARK